MRRSTLALATLATIAIAATFSAAQADSYYGPRKVGNLCWKHQLGNSLGYWEACAEKPAGTAQASVRRPGR
jgi:hypothetical protein